MKKNVMLKIASVLMIAVLLTTCAISSTFAKYTSTATGSASARVAKWGVDATLTFDSLFLDTYSGANGSVIASNKTAEKAGDDIFAPGTYGKANITAEVTGTPEVSVEVLYEAEVTFDGFDTYCPLVFYVNGTKIAGTTAAEKKANLETEIAKIKFTAAPGDDLSSLQDIEIEWEWPFEVDGMDDDDSKLGDLAAEDKAPTFSMSVTVTINQTGAAVVKPAAQG